MVSNHICPSFPPARQIQRVCSKNRRKQTADLKSTRLPNLLQILTHYASFAARYISTAQSEECFSVAFIFSWHHLSPIEKPFHRRTNPYGQKKEGKKKSAHAHTEWHTEPCSHQSKEEKKVLTCILRQSLRYYSPDLGRFVNIPGYSLDVVQASTLIFCSIFIQSVEQTRTQVSFPPSLLQDRCERSWPSRSTCIPAVKLARRQETPL